jgi:Ca-activated chloride channel family protein
MLDAKKARKIYEDIVRRMIDPALLEYYGQGLFKARIFPIEAHSTKRVKISYREILKKNNGTIEYLYPLNTEKFSAKPLKDVRVKVDIKSKNNIKNVYCTTHESEILRKGNHHAVASYEANNVKPDKDFNLYYSTDKSKIGLSLLTNRVSGEDGYFIMNISPDMEIARSQVEEKDIAFVLDVSGSMAGEKMEQARKALSFCVENLNKGDRFEIIRFSTEAEAVFGKLAKAEKPNLDKARKFIKELRAIGGTNIEEALQMALKSKKDDKRSFMVLFITDGKPTIGETKEDPLLDIVRKANVAKTRIFTFGIGHEINTHLLDKITSETKAYRTYISPEEDIEVKISDIYTKIQSPVFTNLELSVGSPVKISKMYPKDLPDLFKGSSITILGRYTGSGNADIVLKGRMRGKIHAMEYTRKFAKTHEQNEFIPPLWAARRIGYLLDQIRLNGENKELVDEVTVLAREHGIITPYTSYLILEDEAQQVTSRRMEERHQTLRNVVPRASGFEEAAADEYKMMKKAKSGRGSVRASKEVQALNKSRVLDQVLQGKSRLTYRDKTGTTKNIAQQFKNIQGRAVYNSGKFWIDSWVQKQKKKKAKRIQFASKEYFDLLTNEPLAGQFLALGKNVNFVLKGQVYEVYE